MTNPNFLVPTITLGDGITVLGTIRSLNKAGIKTYSIGKSAVDEKYSKYYKSLLEVEDLSPDGSNLPAILSKLPFEKAVLMPCSDSWTLLVAALPGDLKAKFPASVNSLETQNKFIDKLKFKELLINNKIPFPLTVDSAEKISDLNSLRKDTRFFLKPRDSQRFSIRFQTKGIWADSKEDCIKKFHDLSDQGFKMIIQEYIPGPPSNHIYVEGFIDREGIPKAIFARRRLRMNPQDFGNSTMMVSIPLFDVESAKNDLLRLLASVNFRGIFSAEFKQDPRDGIFKLIEVNARPWWYVNCPTKCGINVPQLAYLDALNLEVPNLSIYKTGIYYMNFLSDFHLFRSKFKTDKLEALKWGMQWLHSHTTVFEWNDPYPGMRWVFRRLVGRIKK